jgi:hypothetical protein
MMPFISFSPFFRVIGSPLSEPLFRKVYSITCVVVEDFFSTVVELLSCTTGGGGDASTLEENDRSTVLFRTTRSGPHAITLIVRAKIVATRIFCIILLLLSVYWCSVGR